VCGKRRKKKEEEEEGKESASSRVWKVGGRRREDRWSVFLEFQVIWEGAYGAEMGRRWWWFGDEKRGLNERGR